MLMHCVDHALPFCQMLASVLLQCSHVIVQCVEEFGLEIENE